MINEMINKSKTKHVFVGLSAKTELASKTKVHNKYVKYHKKAREFALNSRVGRFVGLSVSRFVGLSACGKRQTANRIPAIMLLTLLTLLTYGTTSEST